MDPIVNNAVMNMNLTKLNVVLRYGDKEFITFIDYIEEVIAHNNFLNDLYNYFPSLKQLFMDFPQILFVPIMYVLLFLIFMLLLLPLYMYLSYKRKRRILYDREDKKNHRVWAGVLGIVQGIFVISILFSPLNGINRIYQNAIHNTLDEEYDSLCDENAALSNYSIYCDILSVYDSTVFATIGGNDSISDYTFNSLTRISYGDDYTSLSKEASLIIKSGIVLDQSGLLESISNNDETIPISLITDNKLDDSDIDIIIETLSDSKYSESVLIELEILVSNTLNDLMKELLNNKEFKLDYSLTKEEAIEEIKIILNAITLLKDSTLISDLLVAQKKIEYFVDEIPENRKNEITVMSFIVDLVNTINLNEFETFCEYLLESKTFNKIIPYILDNFFGMFGLNFVLYPEEILDQFYNVIDLGKIIKRYNTKDIFELIQLLNDEELLVITEIFNYVVSSPSSHEFVRFIVGLAFGDLNYYVSDFLAIKDWTSEIEPLKILRNLLYKGQNNLPIGINDVKPFLEYKDSDLVQFVIKLARNNASFFLREFIVK